MLEGDTPQKRGRSWEPLFAESIGATPIKMSGAGFFKLDVKGTEILWSLKYTEAASATLSNALFREALEAINGPGGVGSRIPGIALNIQGQEYMVFRKDDAMMLMTNDQVSVAAPIESNKAKSLLPEYLR